MTTREREQIIHNALRDYNAAKHSRDSGKIACAINEMENVYICVSLWGVKGTETLRQTILSAKEA